MSTRMILLTVWLVGSCFLASCIHTRVPLVVALQDDDPSADVRIVTAAPYFRDSVVVTNDAKLELGFVVWNASERPIMLAIRPQPIAHVVSVYSPEVQSADQARFSKPASRPRDAGREEFVLLEGSKLMSYRNSWGFSVTVPIPTNTATSNLAANLDFRVAYFLGGEFYVEHLRKTMSILLRPDMAGTQDNPQGTRDVPKDNS